MIWVGIICANKRMKSFPLESRWFSINQFFTLEYILPSSSSRMWSVRGQKKKETKGKCQQFIRLNSMRCQQWEIFVGCQWCEIFLCRGKSRKKFKSIKLCGRNGNFLFLMKVNLRYQSLKSPFGISQEMLSAFGVLREKTNSKFV